MNIYNLKSILTFVQGGHAIPSVKAVSSDSQKVTNEIQYPQTTIIKQQKKKEENHKVNKYHLNHKHKLWF